MAVDAGQSTGLCVVEFKPHKAPSLLYVNQFKKNITETVHFIGEMYTEHKVDVIVSEQFDLRPGNKFIADLTTVYINGGMMAWFPQEKTVWQTPAQAKGLVKNQALKNLKFWQTGSMVGEPDANDANDALRHAVYYGVTVLNHMETIHVGWPEEED